MHSWNVRFNFCLFLGTRGVGGKKCEIRCVPKGRWERRRRKEREKKYKVLTKPASKRDVLHIYIYYFSGLVCHMSPSLFSYSTTGNFKFKFFFYDYTSLRVRKTRFLHSCLVVVFDCDCLRNRSRLKLATVGISFFFGVDTVIILFKCLVRIINTKSR